MKIVVLNNGTLGFVEMEMKAAGFLETGVALVNPDFAPWRGGPASSPDAWRIRPICPARCARCSPMTDRPCSTWSRPRQELAMPPKIGLEQAKGFGIWLARAVIDGRGTEILDLRQDQLWR